jgi:hypothetical protein
MSEWAQFKIQVPGVDLLKDVRTVLETLLIFLEIAKTILETVKIFLIDFGNPIKPLVEALIKLILSFIESLNQTGLYLYADVPDFKKDPELRRMTGGSRGFISRWQGSLLDAKDSNRPQPSPSLTGGFVMLAVDAEGPTKLIAILKVLLRFFNQEFLSPRYSPPANVRAIPVGDSKDPILSLAKVFTDPPTAIAVEWTLPTNTHQTDNGFENLAQSVNSEFVPPNFLIERSSKPVNKELSWDLVKAGSKDVGYVTMEAETQFEVRGQPQLDKRKKRKIRMTDENGDPFIKFEQYMVVATNSATSTFILGQLGKYRWIDTAVEKDKTYFYRVRAFSGTVTVESDDTIIPVLANRNEKESPASGLNQYIQWPGPKGESAPIMGRASGTVQCRIVDLPTDFDVLENIRRVLLTAISFNFHLEAPADAKFKNDVPVDGTPATWLGMGSLFGKTSLATFDTVPLVSYLAATPDAMAKPDPITGNVPEMPWQQTSVRFQAARMTSRIGSAMLNAGSGVINQFKSTMEGPFPKGTPGVAPLSSALNLKDLVAALTKVTYSTPGGRPDFKGTVDLETANAYVAGFSDVATRANVLAAVRPLMALTFSGIAPDWVQVSLIRDLIPWSGQLLYELMEKIQAMLDSFKGILDEIKLFIDLLVRKINVLEEFIQFLISILDFIDSLSVGFYFLSASGLSGGVGDWIAAIDTATGDGPSSGPTGYTGGLCLAYLAPDVTAFTAAFSLIFG